ncbi:MAG TPA: cobalamin biosynthesis protein, partial [Candidatus Accumulibacter phosphatis]|nr:cobalamin biosynthesis protein [Candidatus Accumulibacter phosphatis]
NDTATYDGQRQQRPPLGEGRPASAADIPRALTLVRRSLLLWLVLLLIGGWLRV